MNPLRICVLLCVVATVVHSCIPLARCGLFGCGEIDEVNSRSSRTIRPFRPRPDGSSGHRRGGHGGHGGNGGHGGHGGTGGGIIDGPYVETEEEVVGIPEAEVEVIELPPESGKPEETVIIEYVEENPFDGGFA